MNRFWNNEKEALLMIILVWLCFISGGVSLILCGMPIPGIIMITGTSVVCITALIVWPDVKKTLEVDSKPPEVAALSDEVKAKSLMIFRALQIILDYEPTRKKLSSINSLNWGSKVKDNRAYFWICFGPSRDQGYFILLEVRPKQEHLDFYVTKDMFEGQVTFEQVRTNARITTIKPMEPNVLWRSINEILTEYIQAKERNMIEQRRANKKARKAERRKQINTGRWSGYHKGVTA